MKKIIGLVALLLLCIAGTAFAAGVPMVQTTGTIVKVEDDKATIKANDSMNSSFISSYLYIGF